MNNHEHWETVYRTKVATEVSWYARHLEESQRLIRGVAPTDAAVIDVGGGASTLVDDLLALGYHRITVLDISETALALARTRVSDPNGCVAWVAADVTTVELPAGAYDVWHDRAVFHFLTDEFDRRAYVARLDRSLKVDGYAIIGTFSLEGPRRCSGLDVVRYDVPRLQHELGTKFVLLDSIDATHVTPGKKEQRFLICLFRKQA